MVNYTDSSPLTFASGNDYVLGYLDLNITQADLSRATIKEIDPVDILDLFGNVGGLWGENSIL